MGLLLSMTMAAGLVASKLLLMAGVTSIPVRYPLSVVIAYLIFLGLMRMWVGYVLLNFPPLRPSGSGWDLADDSLDVTDIVASGGVSNFPSLDLDIDVGEGIWILVALAALVLVIFFAGGYLVYVAPDILPDIAFNALLAGCLSGAVKRAESRGWVRSVLCSTWIPLTIVLAMTIGLAVAIHRHCPGAVKLANALACQVEAP